MFTHPGSLQALLLQNSHSSLTVRLSGGTEPGGHPWCTQSVQNTERLISPGDSSGRFLSYLSLGLAGWLLSLGNPVGCYIKFDWQQGGRYWRARDLTRFPASATPAWDELVIKFQRQLGYDPSVSTFFSCSVSGLQCPGSMLGIILHCPHSQTSESGVTGEIYWLFGQLRL